MNIFQYIYDSEESVLNTIDKNDEIRRGISYSLFRWYFGSNYMRFNELSYVDWYDIVDKEICAYIAYNQLKEGLLRDIIVYLCWYDGIVNTTRFLQKLLGVTPSGRFGEMTIDKVNSADQKLLITTAINHKLDMLSDACMNYPEKTKMFKKHVSEMCFILLSVNEV